MFQPMYLEQLAFVIKKADWQVPNLYFHYTFKQDCFKNDLILMNQRSRQNAKNAIEKDFYKLMNNSNFGYDCRNNRDNCQFVPILDELQEITYHKKILHLLRLRNFKICIEWLDKTGNWRKI